MFFRDLVVPWCACDCRHLRVRVVVVVFLWWVVVSSRYDVLVFIVVMRYLFVFGRFG